MIGKSLLVFPLALNLVCGIAAGQGHNSREARSGVVATINGSRVISSVEIDELIASQVFSLQERIYTLRKNALDNLITKIVLENEATARGITVEQLKKQLMPDNIEIRQDRVDEAYLENKNALGNMPEDEAKQRIRLDLESRERLEKYKTVLSEIKTRAQIVVSLPEPVPPTIKVSEEGPSKGGTRDAAVTIVEFSDFQCPYCKQAAETIRQVVQGYGDNVRLIFKHLPLPIHPDAFKAAQASACAAEQGKFWEYHDRLFVSSSLSGEALIDLAVAIGIDRTQFGACIDSERSRSIVAKDLREARQAEIQSTPTFIINGKMLKGARSQEDFKKVIDEEIHSHQKKLSTGPK